MTARKFLLQSAVLAILGVGACLLYWSLVALPGSMAPTTGDESERFAQVNEARRTVAQIVGGVVVLLAGLSTAWLTIRRVNALEKQVALAAEGQITERLSRGIEQLGATSDSGPIPEIRAGAVFTLERVAKESEASFEPVFQILMGYLRTHSPVSEESEVGIRDSLRMDVEAALSALERLTNLQPRQATVVLPRVHMPQASFSGADLAGANLSRAYIVWADLAMANLSRANLIGTYLDWVDLSGANLTGALLLRASFRAANLSRANLSRTDVEEGNFTMANLSDASLEGASLLDAKFTDANLRGADLTGADLSGSDLRGADLTTANLGGCDLTGADLRGSDLTGANLGGANLGGASLGGASLGETNLGGADLTGADLTGADLSLVVSDATTRWPDGFGPQPASPSQR